MPDTKVETSQQKSQEQTSLKELSEKIKETTNELNQLKNGLSVFDIEEQDRKLSEIEDLILDCNQDLKHLETESLSISEKKELEKLKIQIDVLKSSNEQLKKQIEQKTKAEMDQLSKAITKTQSKEVTVSNGQNKGIESKSQSQAEKDDKKERGRLGRQRDAITSKEEWKENTGKNILRAVGGLGVVAGTVALCKRIFGGGKWETKIEGYDKMSRKEKKAAREKWKKENRDKGPFRERPIGKILKWTGIGTAAYYVAHGLKTGKWHPKDFFDWSEGGSKLSIEDSLNVAAGEVSCGKISESMYMQNFKGIEYDKNTQEISSYGESTKINEEKKCIEGLEKVKFKDNLELVHAANIVNCLKYNLRGKGAVPNAFSETKNGGDIEFNFSKEGVNEVISGSNTDLWRNILTAVGLGGGVAIGVVSKSVKLGIGSALGLGALGYIGGEALDNNSSLGKCCSTIKDGDNFKLFIGYLNSLKEGGESLWIPGDQILEDNNKTPIQKYVNEVITEIQNTNVTDVDSGKARNLKVEQDSQDKNKYTVSSYGQSVDMVINGSLKYKSNGELDTSSIKSIVVKKYTNCDIGGELMLNFSATEKGLKEAIKVINLTNMIRKEYGGKGGDEYPIFYNTKNFYQGNAHVLAPNSKYKAGLWIDTKGHAGTRILTNEALAGYPTLQKDLHTSEASTSEYFENQLNGKRNGSKYLKFLNGMRTDYSQNFWTNGQNT